MFRYNAVAADGETLEGEMEARSSEVVAERLRAWAISILVEQAGSAQRGRHFVCMAAPETAQPGRDRHVHQRNCNAAPCRVPLDRA